MNLEEALEQVGIQPSEVWDQEEHLLWFAKIYPECGNIRDLHSKKGIELAGKIIKVLLEDEGYAECFPYEIVDELKVEFGI